MDAQEHGNLSIETEAMAAAELPRYESPRIQELSERDILNSFQLTQSMVGWWVTM